MKPDTDLLQRILEGVLMASGKPLSVRQLADLFEEDGRPENDVIRAALEDIQDSCRDRGYELKQIASGYRFQVIQEVSSWVSRLWEEKPQRYSRALLETLSLIAYRQPITRGDIESIRGVAVSSTIVKTLLERDWVRVVGHKDVPGRPAMYATTRGFLDYFNLRNLDELPSLAEIRDLDSMNEELALEGVDSPDMSEVDAGDELTDDDFGPTESNSATADLRLVSDSDEIVETDQHTIAVPDPEPDPETESQESHVETASDLSE